VHTPVWHETGWWDVDVEETIRSYHALDEQGGTGARGQQWIVIGPWTHEGIRTGRAGELTFGYNSVQQNPSLMPLTWEGGLWSAYELGHNPFYTPPADRARIYFVGEQGNTTAPNNTWYTLPNWPPQSHPMTLSIDSGGLTTKPGGAAWTARFDCDPSKPIATRGGANLPLGGQVCGPMDQRTVERSPGVITLRSEPLSKRLSAAGTFTAHLYVSTDAADTDVMVKLLDVYPDGRAMLIADRAMRLSWWCQQRGLGSVQPGRSYELSYPIADRAWVFEKGHRIGFDVQASNFPRFDVNPGTGAALSGGKMVVQHNTLSASQAQPSGFSLPVFDPGV
jgi:putative CocE/NonD family hydrolase